MKRLQRTWWIVLASSAMMAAAGCNEDTVGTPADGGKPPDYAPGTPPDLLNVVIPDLYGIDFTGVQNECGDTSPGCMKSTIGPPSGMFPLQSDPKGVAGQRDDGVVRDPDGYLKLGATHNNYHFLWIANTDDWATGTVSKIDSKTVRETARYFTVTCFSNPGGSTAACDGTKGCCSRDDYVDYNYRKANGGKSSGKHQGIQTHANLPSRTAVDYNGDVWVSNRAFSGQSSVTKIANDLSGCIDRNGNGKIETSTDVNGDGIINTDCNGDSIADDIASVKKKPCLDGKQQEFYGLDDECLLFTTNTNVFDSWGRPIALGRGDQDFSPADAWAGSWQDGKFFRIDGKTGMTKDDAQIDGNPYGAVIDSNGILWVARMDSNSKGDPAGLSWFDTNNPKTGGGVVRYTVGDSQLDVQSYGIGIDRDQNIWSGGYESFQANRYTPDRSAGTSKLGKGLWTLYTNVGKNDGATGKCRGIAVDSRTQNSYFAWVTRNDGWIVRIPASTTPLPMGKDQYIDGSAFPAMQVAGSDTIGVGVDTDQNVWGVSYTGSIATRIKVDQNGAMTKPDITTGTPGKGCPIGKGDRCTADSDFDHNLDPYTYSDFTGFGLRNFTNPKGYYAYVVRGCKEGKTRWLKVVWDSVVPAKTSLILKARSGQTPLPDSSWGPYTMDFATSPALLEGKLQMPGSFLEVEFDLSTMDATTSPLLKNFNVVYECDGIVG